VCLATISPCVSQHSIFLLLRASLFPSTAPLLYWRPSRPIILYMYTSHARRIRRAPHEPHTSVLTGSASTMANGIPHKVIVGHVIVGPPSPYRLTLMASATMRCSPGSSSPMLIRSTAHAEIHPVAQPLSRSLAPSLPLCDLEHGPRQNPPKGAPIALYAHIDAHTPAHKPAHKEKICDGKREGR
jgi:hypothetical protein